MQYPCTLSEAKGAVDYAVSWPLSSPLNAFKFGRKQHLAVGLVAGALGIPGIAAAFIVGPAIGAFRWLTS